jgi:hypothetical protein
LRLRLINASLPKGITASTNIHYGSGFTNGGYDPAGSADPNYPNPYLPAHTNIDISIGKSFSELRSIATFTARKREQ